MKYIKAKNLFLPLIIAASLFLKLYNIYFQHPRLFSETVWIWNRTLTCVPAFSEKYVLYPALFQIILFTCEWIFFSFGRLFGFFSSIIDFDTQRVTNLLMFITMGRVIVVCFSIGTIFLVYKLGKKVKSHEMGLIAAAFLTFNCFYLRESRFLCYAVPSAFFIALAFLFIWDIFLYGRKKDYVLAGLMMGIGIAFHFQQLLLIPTLFIAHFLRERKTGRLFKIIFEEKIWISIILMGTSFIILNPYILWQFDIFIEKFLWNFMRFNRPAISSAVPMASGYMSYFNILFKYDWLVLSLAVFGLIICLRNKSGILLSSFPLFFYICYGKASEVYSHWMIAIMPFLALLAAYSLIYLVEKTYLCQKNKKILLFFSSAAALILSLINIINADFFIPEKNINIAVQEWVSKKIPQNIRLLDENLKLKDDKPILNKIHSFFFIPAIENPLMSTYKGPVVRISGIVMFAGHKGESIKVCLRNKKYYPSGPVSLVTLSGPGEYSILVPEGIGESIIIATAWLKESSETPETASKEIAVNISKSDIADIDLSIPGF